MKVDILAFAAHPDDVELGASGTLLKEASLGKKVGIIDLTQGELGTRGSAELRMQEAAKSAEILGLSCRENLGMKDGFFVHDEEHIKAVIRMIRKYQPDIVLANAPADRHPDHGRGGKLVAEACFYSGLRRIETELDGVAQEAWRPRSLYHYIQDYYIEPDVVVDITAFKDQKMESVKAFSSQFYDPKSKEPESPIAVKNFFQHLEGRMTNMGRYIQAEYGEGFVKSRPLGVDSLTNLI